MRLTIDWDTEVLKEMHLDAVLSREPAGEDQRRLAEFGEGGREHSDKWELWASSTHGQGDEDGYHYVEYDLPGTLEDIRNLRQTFGDDKLRMSLDGDRIRVGSPYPQVLYHLKGIKPGEYRPYDTGDRAELLRREWPVEEAVEIKNEDGTLNYAKITEELVEHPDFQSRAALFRRIQQRGSVDVDTQPRKRGYDVAKGRREPTRAESKALRDYAEARDIGHYGEPGVPDELQQKPNRSVFHEFFQVPDLEDFDVEPGESEWQPANVRTGTYGSVDEHTLKQAHDDIASYLIGLLSPGPLNLNRLSDAISLERERPLDRDEKARYRRVFWQNQPGTSESRVQGLVSRDDHGDPYRGSTVLWEIIVYEEEYSGVWWVARGVLDADRYSGRRAVPRSTIIADTEDFL